jgi:hypothetical protein
MKQWLCWFFLMVGVVLLLWIPHRRVSPHLRPQAVGDQSVLNHNEFAFTRCRVLRTVSPAFLRNRTGPLEFFATTFGFLIADTADDHDPPWLDYRGPPGPNRCSQRLLISCNAASQVGSLAEHFPAKFRASVDQIQNVGFAPAFS